MPDSTARRCGAKAGTTAVCFPASAPQTCHTVNQVCISVPSTLPPRASHAIRFSAEACLCDSKTHPRAVSPTQTQHTLPSWASRSLPSRSTSFQHAPAHRSSPCSTARRPRHARHAPAARLAARHAAPGAAAVAGVPRGRRGRKAARRAEGGHARAQRGLRVAGHHVVHVAQAQGHGALGAQHLCRTRARAWAAVSQPG